MSKTKQERFGSRYRQSNLNSDLTLTMLTFFGLATALIMTPFALYRLVVGDLALAAVNSSVILVFGLLVIYARRTGNSELAGMVIASMITLLALVSTGYLETSVAWIYVVVTANFLLADRRFALLATVFIIIATGVQSHQFQSQLDQVTFLATAGLLCMLNLIFATRINHQHQALSELATCDPLTLAGNRRAMTRDLQAAVEAYRFNPEPVGVVMLDLDRFKRLNDEHGHDAGDQVLVNLAALTKSRIRRGDGFYRFGGEEFVLMLPGTDRGGLEVVLSNLRQSILASLKGPDGPITVSMGAAVLKPDESWSEWLARADEALYRAKRDGRDRISFAD